MCWTSPSLRTSGRDALLRVRARGIIVVWKTITRRLAIGGRPGGRPYQQTAGTRSRTSVSVKKIFVLPLIGLVLTGGCRVTADHSPTIDVIGSYFPAWMVCILSGLVLTLVVRQMLITLKLDVHVRPLAVVYVCLMIIFTLATWLLFFQN